MALASLLLLTATATTAAAGDVSSIPLPPPVPPATAEARRLVTAQMEDYFAAEKAQGLVFLGTGLASLATGGLLLTRGDGASDAAVYPTMGIGVAQAVVGAVLLLRTDDQVDALRYQLARDPFRFVDDERLRMDRVEATFSIIEIVEIALAVAGASLFVVGEMEDEPALQGIGLSVAAESLLMLGYDYLAASRAHRYAGALRVFDDSLRRP